MLHRSPILCTSGSPPPPVEDEAPPQSGWAVSCDVPSRRARRCGRSTSLHLRALSYVVARGLTDMSERVLSATRMPEMGRKRQQGHLWKNIVDTPSALGSPPERMGGSRPATRKSDEAAGNLKGVRDTRKRHGHKRARWCGNCTSTVRSSEDEGKHWLVGADTQLDQVFNVVSQWLVLPRPRV